MRSLLPTAYVPREALAKWGSLLPLSRVARGAALLLILLGLAGIILRPQVAYADPHAVFYTDTGQKQVFFNVLAALNQADYVEPPGQPSLPPPDATPPNIQDFVVDTTDVDSPAALHLPRIRVRAVTPDNGDVYFRMRLLELKRAVKVRYNLEKAVCNFLKYANPESWQAHKCDQT